MGVEIVGQLPPGINDDKTKVKKREGSGLCRARWMDGWIDD